MKYITIDTKWAQLEPSGSTLLGLDDNRLCQWDIVISGAWSGILPQPTPLCCIGPRGISSQGAPTFSVLNIRLHSKTSMRQAKTAFPGLGSPMSMFPMMASG